MGGLVINAVMSAGKWHVTLTRGARSSSLRHCWLCSVCVASTFVWALTTAKVACYNIRFALTLLQEISVPSNK